MNDFDDIFTWSLNDARWEALQALRRILTDCEDHSEVRRAAIAILKLAYPTEGGSGGTTGSPARPQPPEPTQPPPPPLSPNPKGTEPSLPAGPHVDGSEADGNRKSISLIARDQPHSPIRHLSGKCERQSV